MSRFPLVTLNNSGNKPIGNRQVSSIILRALAGKETVLEVAHDPRPLATAGTPHVAVAEVNTLHMAGAGILTIDFSIAIVEAAAAVIVRPVEHCVDALGCVPAGRAVSRVVPVPAAGCDEDAIHPLPAECYRRSHRTC